MTGLLSRRARTHSAVICIALSGACASSERDVPLTPCVISADTHALAPSHDLYCIQLMHIPTDALDSTSATLELNRIPSPFGANVNRDGAIIYATTLRANSLPDPAAFDSGARTWVAWIATPTMYPTLKLGAITNGTTTLPNIDWTKFFVLVTAERSRDVAEPTGKVALRGFSPSWRMQPPDMTEFLYGAIPDGSGVGGRRSEGARTAGSPDPGNTIPDPHAAHAATAPQPASGAASWIHPPMPKGLAMMPAEM